MFPITVRCWLRDECLNVEWFVSLNDARQKLVKFRITITNGRTARWPIERRRHSRSSIGAGRKN